METASRAINFGGHCAYYAHLAGQPSLGGSDPANYLRWASMDSSEHIRDVSNANKIAYAYLNTFLQSAHTLLAANISLHCHCAISVS